MWDWFLAGMGWDYLTPQGIRFGIVGFIALGILAPPRPSGEVILNVIISAIGAILLAQAVSLTQAP